jgi:hypothetical protein
VKLRHVINTPKIANDARIDEYYSLRLATNGDAEISATSGVGILRGLTTFSQLFYTHSKVQVSASYTL